MVARALTNRGVADLGEQSAGAVRMETRAVIRSRLKPGKPLKRTPLNRNTRLERRGGSMFKLTADDKAQWKWMLQFTLLLGPCDCGCGRWGDRHRAHLIPRGRTGAVVDNVVLLLPVCHTDQEKDTERFCVRRNVDLYAKARAHTAQWRKETA